MIKAPTKRRLVPAPEVELKSLEYQTQRSTYQAVQHICPRRIHTLRSRNCWLSQKKNQNRLRPRACHLKSAAAESACPSLTPASRFLAVRVGGGPAPCSPQPHRHVRRAVRGHCKEETTQQTSHSDVATTMCASLENTYSVTMRPRSR